MRAHESCTLCGSSKIVLNGKTATNKQQFHCKACGCYRTFDTKQSYSPERRAEILKTYDERASLRGIKRVYGVALTTTLRWLKKRPAASGL